MSRNIIASTEPSIIENNDQDREKYRNSAELLGAPLVSYVVLMPSQIDALLAGKCVAVVDDTTSFFITIK